MTVVTDGPLAFRFWDGEKMHYDISRIDFSPKLKVYVNDELYTNGILMQRVMEDFDKGKGLYDGDILKGPNGKLMVIDFEPIFVGWVKWDNDNPEGEDIGDEDKIVGNKYENPDLYREIIGEDGFEYEKSLKKKSLAFK